MTFRSFRELSPSSRLRWRPTSRFRNARTRALFARFNAYDKHQ